MNIMQMSLQASVIIVVVVVIRALGMGRLPKWSFQLLWAVALMRLLVPLRIESPVSVYGAVQRVERVWSNMATPITAAPGGHAPTAAMQQAGEALEAILPKAAQGSPWLIVWIVGAALMLGYFAFTHIRCRMVYKAARAVSDTRVSELPCSRPLRIRASGCIEAPLTYGVLRPVILLPERFLRQGDHIEYVIAHELAHVRHWDILKRWLLTICLCVHWFNPLVWVMYILAGRDIELCCDETVLRKYGAREKARYASLLIDMEEARTALTPLASHFNKTAIEERIVAIMKHKKVSFLGIILALVLVVFTASALATNAVTNRFESKDAIEMTSGDAGSAPTTWGGMYENEPQDDQTRFAPYAQYGLAYNAANGRLYYNGELVRHFEDTYALDANTFTGVTQTYQDGAVDVRSVRDMSVRRYYEDGGYDPSGLLVGLEKLSQAEFDENTVRLAKSGESNGAFTESPATYSGAADDIHAQTAPQTGVQNEPTASVGMQDTVGPSTGPVDKRYTAEVYSIYAKYGLAYDQATDALSYNGQLVRYFRDILESNGMPLDSGLFKGSMRMWPNDSGTVDVYAERDASGNLTGLRVASQREFDERTQAWARKDYASDIPDSHGVSNTTESALVGNAYTQEELDAVMSLKVDGYEEMTVAEFYSYFDTAIAKSKQSDYFFKSYEKITPFMLTAKPENEFIATTLRLTFTEITARITNETQNYIRESFKNEVVIGIEPIDGNKVYSSYLIVPCDIFYVIDDTSTMTVGMRDKAFIEYRDLLQQEVDSIPVTNYTSDELQDQIRGAFARITDDINERFPGIKFRVDIEQVLHKP